MTRNISSQVNVMAKSQHYTDRLSNEEIDRMADYMISLVSEDLAILI